jgi:hypothetical protein
MKYVVFLGAPSPSNASTSLDDSITSYHWRTVAPTPDPLQLSKKISLEPPLYPSSALDAASLRISAVYENIIFGGRDDEDEGDTQIVEEELTHDTRGMAVYLQLTLQLTIRASQISRPGLRRHNLKAGASSRADPHWRLPS